MKKQLLILAILLTGCAGQSKIIPTGNDTYLISSHGVMGYSSGDEQKVQAYEEANKFCQSQGKKIETVYANDSGAGGYGRISSAQVNFRCK